MARSTCPGSLTSLHRELYLLCRPIAPTSSVSYAKHAKSRCYRTQMMCTLRRNSGQFLEKRPETLICDRCNIFFWYTALAGLFFFWFQWTA